MHGRWLSRGSHKGAAAAAATLGTSAGLIQQADGGDATSSLVFIQAANRLCCSHEENKLYNSSGFLELACVKPSSMEIQTKGLAEIKKRIRL